jgi:hypothetical protein
MSIDDSDLPVIDKDATTSNQPLPDVECAPAFLCCGLLRSLLHSSQGPSGHLGFMLQWGTSAQQNATDSRLLCMVQVC